MFRSTTKKATDQQIEEISRKILKEFIGSGKNRLGPEPNEQSKAYMLSIISHNVKKNHPIPILAIISPAKTPIGAPLDVAEHKFLYNLKELHTRICCHYARGIHMRIRLEDATFMVVFGDTPYTRQLTRDYTQKLFSLTSAMGCDSFITFVGEMDLVPLSLFVKEVKEIVPFMYSHIEAVYSNQPNLADLNHLHSLGWHGSISLDTVQHLLRSYETLYPENSSKSDHLMLMAKYFSCTLARRRLGAVGPSAAWHDWLEISFIQMPGAVSPDCTKRICYRSVERSLQSSNVAFWRARGMANGRLYPLSMPFSGTESKIVVKTEEGTDKTVEIVCYQSFENS